MPSLDDKSSPLMLRGRKVLLSRAALALLGFWLLLALALLLPTPLRTVLSEGGSRATSGASSGSVGSPAAPMRATHSAIPAAKRAPSPPAQAIEDPHESLASFARALKVSTSLVRVLHLGDSQIDLDHISGHMRERMQRRHGRGGHGLLPAIRPWRWFRQRGIAYGALKGTWRRYRLGGGSRPDSRLGLGMLAAESEGRASSRIELGESVEADRLGLSYLAGPGLGSVALYVDGKHVGGVEASSPRHEARLLHLTISPPARVLRVVTRGRVRLFGLILERQGEKGITWENLPAVSGRFHQLAQLDATILSQQLQQRLPAMVVFQFGANDAIKYGDSITSYQRNVKNMLERIRALPDVACLVIGPLDQQEKRNGKLRPRRNVDLVLEAQRAAARSAGCAFWDARAAMGGKGSIVSWRARRLTRADLVHLNKKGAAELTRLLDAALTASLRRFR